MPLLHIAIDCRVIDPHFPGIGRATLETVRGLVALGATRRLTLLVGRTPTPEVAALAAQPGVDLIPLPVGVRSPGDQVALPRLLRTVRPDLYHASYYALPVALPGRVVVTIYDLIPRLFPEYWPNPVARGVINGWTALAARRATRVIAPSRSTAADLIRLLPATRDKVRVVPLGVTAPVATGDARQAAPATRPPLLLYVGSNKPHKNLPRLIEAFATVAGQSAGTLIVAGAWDQRYPEALAAVERLGLGGRVWFEHRPSDERLATLYRSAAAFVFPSLYEGFGLPVLEAMAAGLPVATTDRGSLAEVAGEAALRFDPTDTGSIADALQRLLTDGATRSRLQRLGLAQAALFPWSRTARETLAVYEEAACG